MLAGPHALIPFWVITSIFVVHPVREANFVCIPLRGWIRSLCLYITGYSVYLVKKPSHEDVNSLHDLLVR
jgi:hypothetical protein